MILASEFKLTQSFLVVAEELNFRRSAERLNLDQSALTRRIQKLEQLLGFALFERSTHEVILTPAGRLFYEKSAQLCQDYLQIVSSSRLVAQGKIGRLRIAYMSFAATKLMPEAVRQFRKIYNTVDVNLRYLRTQQQKLALAQDEIDLGFMIGPFDHSDFHSLLLRTDPLYVVMPPDHPLLEMSQITVTDLANYDLILGDMIEWEAYRWQLQHMFAAYGLDFTIALEASNTLALLGLVAAGLGITIYPQSLVGFLDRSVAVRPIRQAEFCIQTILVWKRTNRTQAVRNFVEIIKKL